MANHSCIYIVDNKGRNSTLKLWEKQARTFLGIKQSTIANFILGEETDIDAVNPTDALETLTEKLNTGDVLITDGNKIDSDYLYQPLLSAFDALRNRNLKNIHIVLISANIERVDNFRHLLEENRFNEDTDIHVYCCHINSLRDCLINEVRKRRIFENQPSIPNINNSNHSLKTVRTLFAALKVDINTNSAENNTTPQSPSLLKPGTS